jgi:hypothetical protein
MTLATALPHVQAFQGLLTSLSFTTYLGGHPTTAADDHYAVLYPDPGAVEQTSLTPDEGWVGYISVHGVGVGPEQALWVIDQIRSAVVGQTPTVTGRHVWRIWQEQSPPPLIRDDDKTPPLYVAYSEFGMRSD